MGSLEVIQMAQSRVGIIKKLPDNYSAFYSVLV